MNSSQRTELRTITDTLLDGKPLTARQSERLNVLLTDPAARDFYLQMVETDVHLPASIEHADIITQLEQDAVPPPFPKRRIATIAACAASITFAVGWFVGSQTQVPSQSSAPPPVVQNKPTEDTSKANITSMIGVRWNQSPDSATSPSTIDITSGLVELTYPTGVKVIIEGPANYQVTGKNSGAIDYGRFVANVPKGAEGFTVDYANGKVIDLGTEFGFNLSREGELKLAVFDGEVELHPEGSSSFIKIDQNHAVEQHSDDPHAIQSIPFDRAAYVRETPSREFSWHLDSAAPKTLTFDVSHLIWKPGNFLCVFKWMRGQRATRISNVMLLKNGIPVDSQTEEGVTGFLHITKGNVYTLNVSEQNYERAQWQIKATLQSRSTVTPKDAETVPWSEGILLFEDGRLIDASESDFIGTWKYSHNGSEWQRILHADGTITLTKNRKIHTDFSKAHWEVRSGSLRVWIPHLKQFEDHILRDHNTLIFTDQPYRNAVRVPTEK